VRVVASFLTALVAVGGLGYAAAQTVLAPQPPLELAEPAPRVPVAAPAAARAASGAAAAAPAAAVTQVDLAWVVDVATRTGIPAPAVRAYANAQLTEPASCEVGWTTLAGIGRVESEHGTIGGRTLGDDGRSSEPILGPALDGVGPVAAIRASSESSAWHGDRNWDHAIGPLQFIPSTWERWGTDGDGDGVADPHDLDDAARTATQYLCADGHDLQDGAGWSAALFSYNHAQSYVDLVHSFATQYAEATS